MGTGELNESKHINKPVPGGTVIPQYPYIYIYQIPFPVPYESQGSLYIYMCYHTWLTRRF
mgnify:CR=1 FL=1